MLDTNVVVSALVLRSRSLTWLQAALENENLVPLVSESTEAELNEVFRRPRFGLSPREILSLLSWYARRSERLELFNLPEVPECRDPKDLPFLQLALVARADALVTGDDDLLSLASEFPIPIVTPATLRQKLGDIQ